MFSKKPEVTKEVLDMIEKMFIREVECRSNNVERIAYLRSTYHMSFTEAVKTLQGIGFMNAAFQEIVRATPIDEL